MEFEYNLPVHIVFGRGCIGQLGTEAAKLGKRALLVTGRSSTKKSGLLDRAAALLKDAGVESVVFDKITQNPLTTTVMEGAAFGRDAKCDLVVALGGGSVMDAAKAIALMCRVEGDILDYQLLRRTPQPILPLIAVPTTCGTGSEVTNIAILALNSRGTKKGLAVDEMYADSAVLVPELLNGLPFRFFATSSIDALIHAVESSLSPKGNEMTRLFGYKAIEMILHGYKKIEAEGPEARMPLLEDFLMASLYAGVAFGNAGCAAVHAMSYPLGATFHVAHGESNYAMFTGVMKNYMEIRRDGEIEKLNKFIADILGCKVEDVYEELEKLLNNLIQKKALHEYGMTREQIEEFTDSVIANQGRLMANNFVELDRDRLIKIYTELY